ncbi:MAG: NADH-quinone oxidoreductase subunit H [Actinomycetota bacterium]|nr:NADH-quinone oxidoreductase subunit H [Actinomycetota bacterium]
MSGAATWWLAPLALGAALAGGVYLTAVLDRLVARAVAGVPLGVPDALVAPARGAALLLLSPPAATERPDAQSWALAPALLAAVAAAGTAAIPLGPGLAVADVPDGIVLFGAAMALVMVAVFLHGWSANSAMPLLGGYRFVAQALSYEMPLALVLIAVALPAQSLAVGDIVVAQEHIWNVVRQPLGLPIFLVTAAGLGFWGPLALPDAADVAGGTSVEAAGSALLAWRAARAAVLVAAAAMAAAAFLGGWLGPVLPGPVWMVAKTAAVLVAISAAGHLLARVRLERFVVVAWTVLIPLALVDVFASGILAL